MSAADHERLQQDVGAYLLGALEDHERLDLERHLATCHVCHDEVERLRVAAEALPRSVEQYEPPFAIKRALMKEVYADAPRASRPLADRLRLPRMLARPQFALAATLLALVLGGLGGYAISGGGGTGGSGGAQTVAAVVDGTRIPGGHARVVVPHGRGLAELRVTGMPQPPQGQIYEIWVKRGDAVQPASLFSVDRSGDGAGAVPADLRGVSQVMVTREPRAGALQPSEAPVISAKI